jgi:hypothetical protein
VLLGELAAAVSVRLPGLRGAAVLVVQPEDRRLPPVPNANKYALAASD